MKRKGIVGCLCCQATVACKCSGFYCNKTGKCVAHCPGENGPHNCANADGTFGRTFLYEEQESR